MKTIKDFETTSMNIEETKQVQGGALEPQATIVFGLETQDAILL